MGEEGPSAWQGTLAAKRVRLDGGPDTLLAVASWSGGSEARAAAGPRDGIYGGFVGGGDAEGRRCVAAKRRG